MWPFSRKKNHQKPVAILAYHGSFHEIGTFRPLTHFGSVGAACNRLDDIFTEWPLRPERTRENTRIYEVYLDIRNPLRVVDSWEFNPIGHAWECLFENFPQAKQKEIDFVLQPRKLPKSLGITHEPPSVHELEAEIIRDGIACLPPMPDSNYYVDAKENYENVLRPTAISARFVKIAMKHGYDGIVYSNTHESRGHDSWINFRPAQVHMTGKVFTYPSREDEPNERGPYVQFGVRKLLIHRP